MLYKDFEQKWLTKRVDYDNVGGFQCVDLAKQYMKEVYGKDIGSWGGSAWSGWNKLMKDDSFILYLGGLKFRIPPIGSLVFFEPKTMGNEYGHVGVCAYSQFGSDSIDILEQNGKGGGNGIYEDAIRIHTYKFSQIGGFALPR